MALANGGLQRMVHSEHSMSSNSLNGGAVETLRCRMAGAAWCDRARYGAARFGWVRYGRQGLSWHGASGFVAVRFGRCGDVTVWSVMASLGLLGCGEVSYGVIGYGRYG